MILNFIEQFNFLEIFCDFDGIKERGMHYVGTVRENRLKGCSLRPENEMKKESRGATDSCLEVDSGILAVRWYNKKVDVITSYVGTEPMTKMKRFDRKAKTMIEVPCPFIATYNQNMGGVNLLDSLTAFYNYKAKLKTRCWYLYIFYHTLNMAVVTSWLRYRRQCHPLSLPRIKLQFSS